MKNKKRGYFAGILCRVYYLLSIIVRLVLQGFNKWVQYAWCVALGQVILFKVVKGLFLPYVRHSAVGNFDHKIRMLIHGWVILWIPMMHLLY